MTPLLKIEAKEGIVFLDFVGSIDCEEWQDLLGFWQNYALANLSNGSMQIPVGEFFSKRAWFDVYWIQLGRKVEIDESVAKAIDASEKEVERFQELMKMGYSDPSGLTEDVNDLELLRPLTSEQLTNIASMLAAQNGANFSVPGAGKTATQLALFGILRNQNKIKRMLVICPKSSFEAWQDEPSLIFKTPPLASTFDGSLIHPNSKILVANFEKLESTARRKQLVSWVSQPGGTSLVIDEAHRVKSGSRGVRWRACVELASFAQRVDLLSGTPMPQSYEDLRNLLTLSWRGVPRNKLDDLSLSKLVSGGVFVRTTKGQLGLPEIKIHRVKIKAGKYQSEIYSALTSRYKGLLELPARDQLSLAKRGRAVMSLIAAASNPALISGQTRDDLLHSLGWPPRDLENTDLMGAIQGYLGHEVPPKFEWVVKYVEQARVEKKKTLIWTTFVGNIVLLKTFLRNSNPAVIYGAVAAEDRAHELDRFRHDPDCSVLITNAQTLGEGVSLHHSAHEAIFLDRTYNAAQYLQALDRIHRLGLPSDQLTQIYVLETEETIDTRVGERLGLKIMRLSEVLNDEGLVKVSLPGNDEFQDFDEQLGLDQLDINDLLKHLGED
jgi:SNF2 family DNA or RNA helicase